MPLWYDITLLVFIAGGVATALFFGLIEIHKMIDKSWRKKGRKFSTKFLCRWMGLRVCLYKALFAAAIITLSGFLGRGIMVLFERIQSIG